MRIVVPSLCAGMLLVCTAVAAGQAVLDVAYGGHPRQRLDLYPAPEAAAPAPVVLFIHGGGFVRGDKSLVRPRLIAQLHDAGIAVAAINYRFVTTDPLPAAMHDAARAVQFLRYHAARYHLDPARFAASGTSAGAGISLWLALHDDLADPASDDPVARQSTRLTCVAVSAAQVSYDPQFWRDLGLGAPTSQQLDRIFGPDLPGDQRSAAWRAASPIVHLSPDDPPLRLDYAVPDELNDATPRSALLHHPRHGLALRAACEEIGVPCEVYYPGSDGPEQTPAAFLAHWLKAQRPDP